MCLSLQPSSTIQTLLGSPCTRHPSCGWHGAVSGHSHAVAVRLFLRGFVGKVLGQVSHWHIPLELERRIFSHIAKIEKYEAWGLAAADCFL